MEDTQGIKGGNGATPPESSIRGEINDLVERREVSQAQIARESGIGATTLNRYLKGQYGGDNAKVEHDLQAWLFTRRDREAALPIPVAGWAPTPTGNKVLATLGYCHMANDMGIVFGGAGLGKTRSIAHYKANRANVWPATISPVTATPAAALEEVLRATGERHLAGANSSADIQRHLIRRLQGSGGLLVIDEAQHLSIPALESLRTLHDLAGVGLVFVGNDLVRDRLTGGRNTAYFAQLYSRIGKTLRLQKPSQGDVDILAAAYGVTEAPMLKKLRAIAATPGALRGMVKVLGLASTLAQGEGEPLAIKHITAAWADLNGE